MAKERKHRIVVLGGGPGGYEAALAGAQLGAEVTLVERAGVGGSAVLTDVVPSKSLIATAGAVQSVRDAGKLGVQTFLPGGDGKPVRPEIAVNLAAVNKRLLAMAGAQSTDMRLSLEESGVRLVQGSGRLDGPNAVLVSTSQEGGTDFDRIEADTIVVSVGASPRELDSAKPDGERILTWQQLYNLQDVPEHLIVVGSGVTGAEFANAYATLGAEVTLVSSREQVLPGEDPDAAAVIEHEFKRIGMNVMSKSRADAVERTEDGVRVTLADGRVVEGSHCLMAVGSIPNTEGLGLEEAGVELSESGHIKVNKVARTSIPSVYAAGDCTDFFPLASVASMQGRTAIMHALGDFVRPIDLRNVASNVFTYPEIATVGWNVRSLADATNMATAITHTIPLNANPRAKMIGFTDGFVKLFAWKASGTVIGGVIVAHRASELIFPLALAVEHRLTVDQVASAFTVYPSLTGAITDAARAMHVH
ncbi:dihydrolipoamide dehydrogenase [Mycolicibacterium mucogenicum 261Sha1.1M5]|uniref:NAD(P)H dehydrogenase (quinone) n=1 Tax=Leucobacter aridicollis TaxID=283878 RepID=A0A852R7U5_9MICO|nr:NAD(P)H-quinone dehydrogenase [Leucobacter aridicollis]MBL3683100.1 NAD(P)H-quinone dehydrogenase [Leucobacter aridicollis]MCS3428743.1 dihydrolipoamide dehydrogenase [Leucobacter aridicollis]NYD25326.1 dihydrolipoamide dehydrogenase [Leucobacter aridicollis]RKQ89910.1 dihydrolipoamide dehydrogenase [Mycolicibacterium mucogenicum 261Sha1.1M5]